MNARKTTLLGFASAFILASLTGGCERTLSKSESVRVKSDGTVEKKERTVIEEPDGTIRKEEKKTVDRP
jgi:hypothetical protein